MHFIHQHAVSVELSNNRIKNNNFIAIKSSKIPKNVIHKLSNDRFLQIHTRFPINYFEILFT